MVNSYLCGNLYKCRIPTVGFFFYEKNFTCGFCPYFAGVPMSGKVVSVLGLARPYVASAPISVSPSMSEAENLLFSFAGTPALKLNRAKP